MKKVVIRKFHRTEEGFNERMISKRNSCCKKISIKNCVVSEAVVICSLITFINDEIATALTNIIHLMIFTTASIISIV